MPGIIDATDVEGRRASEYARSRFPEVILGHQTPQLGAQTINPHIKVRSSGENVVIRQGS